MRYAIALYRTVRHCLGTAMVPQGIGIMYIVECTFAGETSTLAAHFTNIVDAAIAAKEQLDLGYAVDIINTENRQPREPVTRLTFPASRRRI